MKCRAVAKGQLGREGQQTAQPPSHKVRFCAISAAAGSLLAALWRGCRGGRSKWARGCTVELRRRQSGQLLCCNLHAVCFEAVDRGGVCGHENHGGDAKVAQDVGCHAIVPCIHLWGAGRGKSSGIIARQGSKFQCWRPWRPSQSSSKKGIAGYPVWGERKLLACLDGKLANMEPANWQGLPWPKSPQQ